MHNQYTKFGKIFGICKQIADNLVNVHGNIPRRGPVSKFAYLKVVALSLAAEFESIDSENCLFNYNLQEYIRLEFIINKKSINCLQSFPILIQRLWLIFEKRCQALLIPNSNINQLGGETLKKPFFNILLMMQFTPVSWHSLFLQISLILQWKKRNKSFAKFIIVTSGA